MSLQQEILNGESRTLEYKVELPEDSPKRPTCLNSRIVLPIRFRKCAYRR